MKTSTSSLVHRSWSVSALCRSISEMLDANFGMVQVVGEVGSFIQAASGHCYFNLKDAQSQIRCAMFRRAAASQLAMPRNGERVEVIARVAIHAARGDLQLVVEGLRPAGQGAAMDQFLRLKAQLEEEGLFNGARKRKVPEYPTCVGVVTSLDAAALSDVLTSIRRRAPHIALVLSPCAVQGVESTYSIVEALNSLYALHVQGTSATSGRPDVILLVRGGGAWEDLQAFNDEAVARCIASSPVPIISGVGHETDFTIADFVADMRAATPTAAAELCTSAQEDLSTRLHVLSSRLMRALDCQLNACAQHLDWMSAAMVRTDDRMHAKEFGLEQLAHRLEGAGSMKQAANCAALNVHSDALRASCKRGIGSLSNALDALASRLEAANPVQVLSRGFAWLEGPKGLVSSINQIEVGERLHATLADGMVELSVADVSS